VCGLAEAPGSLLASPSLQPLTKACRGGMLFPTKAGQAKEGGGHCVLVIQSEWWGWHGAQSPRSSCPLLFNYVQSVTCISSPGSSRSKDSEQTYSSNTADLGAKEKSYLMRQLPMGNAHLSWPTPPWPAEIPESPGSRDKQAGEASF